MAYKLKTDLAHSTNYGSKRNTSNIKYIVIHYTAGDGDTDEANANYFNGANRNASAHYFVDDDSVTQSVPDNYVAWSVGGSKYNNCSTTGGGSLYGKCTNSNSISVEICDDRKNGTIYPSDATIENAIALTKALMKKYGIPASRVIRHFDVTGKSCPAYWCGTTAKNKKWKTVFWNKLSSSSYGSNTSIEKKESFEPYKVKTTTVSLNIRSGAGTKHKVTGVITDNKKLVEQKPGYYFSKDAVYTIVAEKKNGSTTWLKLKSGVGWISSQYTKKC